MRYLPLVAFVLPAFVGGCSDDSRSAGEQLQDSANDYIDFVCQCVVDSSMGELTKSECREEFGGLSIADGDCIDRTLAEYPDLQPIVSCTLDAVEDYVACQQAAGCAAALDGSSVETCDTFETDLANCVGEDSDVEGGEALGACFSGEGD